MKKLLSVTLSLIMLLGLLAGCGNQAANDPSNDQASEYGEVAEFISIGANPSGQTAYTWAAGIADLINKANIGATATAEETNGYPVNANMLASGELEFGFVNNWILAQAYAATDSYSDIQAGKVTGVISLAPTEMHVLTLPGSGVNSLADLAGKRVGVGQPGGISLEITTMMLECAGYQEGDFERLEINLANQCEYLRDGQLDVVIWIGSAALPAITELCATKDVVFLDVDDAIIEKIVMGGIGKYFKEICLLQQPFVKDDKVSVEEHIAAVAKQVGASIKLVNYIRFEKGEGIEKRQDDLAEEVAKLIK